MLYVGALSKVKIKDWVLQRMKLCELRGSFDPTDVNYPMPHSKRIHIDPGMLGMIWCIQMVYATVTVSCGILNHRKYLIK
jgi:hypothetical protein